MSLEGLNTILTKEEIVPTQRSADLLGRPDEVDSVYTTHVRSYIPLSRQAQGEERRESVSDFERRVISGIKDAAALRGYITAEYGYGKTSTALYLWKCAREANILAVPPFVLTQLPDLVTAIYGWLHYELQRTRPDGALLSEAADLYTTITDRSVETLAKQYRMDRIGAQQLIKDRPELLNLNTADYLRFFEEATRIARQAGFDGLLVLADEVQQYIDPEVKTGVKDPISPLFELVSGLITRRNHLHLGLILVLPPKDLDVLRDQRGDLIHRMLQTSLDLRTIYDRTFPARLWGRLAEQFDFTDHSHRIVSPVTLDALGQIAARSDLSDGPRTVINTFRQMTKRYLELGHQPDDPYTPEHLINDFLKERITFNSSKKIPQVTNQALAHSLVKGHLDRECAVKWAAAFPEEGVPRSLQDENNLLKAFDALLESAQGDLVIGVGDVKKRGITLRGLDRVELSKDTLSVLVREFWRTYDIQQQTTQGRAMRGFFNLLTEKVFPSNQWKVLETRQEELLTRNQGLILEGSFAGYSRKFPERRVHVQVLWEDEVVKDASVEGEFLIQLRLKCYLDKFEAERREFHVPLEFDYEARQIKLTLNLMCQNETNVSPNLERAIGAIVSPYKFTPFMMLALYEFINQKRANNAIPKKDDEQIRFMFQPELLDHVFLFLFNAEVGKSVKAAQERILEEASRTLLEAVYPEYETLMLVGNWTSSLAKYKNALKHLETTHEKQGQIDFEGTKDEIAKLFALTNTGLDTFINNFPSLLLIQQPFPTQKEISAGKKGSVRFKLHSLEEKVKKWLADSPDRQVRKISNHSHEVRSMPTNEIYHRANDLGYQYKEIDEILNLMGERGLIVQERGIISEEINQAPSIDDLAREIETWQKDIETLLEVFTQNQMLHDWAKDVQKFLGLVQNLRQRPDDEKAITARRAVQAYRRQLDGFVKDRHQELVKSINQFERTISRPNPQHGKSLNNPVMGGVNYVEQINDLRSRLLKQYSTLVSEVENYQQQVKSLAVALNVNDLEIGTLVKLAKGYKAFQGKNEPLKEKCNAFTKDFEMFTAWGWLVDRGSELSDQIRELGDAVQEEQAKFQKLSQDIMGHLSANKTGALPDAPTYENQLREIAEAVRIIKIEVNNRFSDLQDRYRQALVVSLKFPSDKLWPPYPYNPANPDDSYLRLTQEVRNALQDLHKRLSMGLAGLQDEVRRILQDPSLKTMTVEGKDNIEIKGNSLLKEFEQLDTQLREIQSKLNDILIVTDFPEKGEGKFHQLLAAFQSILNKFTGDVGREVKQLGAMLRTLAPEGEEEIVLATLPKSGSIELSELRQKVSLSEEALWKALRGLYIKRLIRLPIEIIQ